MRLHRACRDRIGVAFARRKSDNSGFTLFEMLIVIGLFALFASVSAVIGFDSITRSTVQNERDLVVMMLTGARARALANVNQRAHGVKIESTQITLFEIDPPSTTMLNIRSTPRNPAIDVSPVTVIFDRLWAGTSGTNIELKQGAKTDTIDISPEGRIEW